MRLDELDDRYLPQAARKARELADRLAARQERWVTAYRGVSLSRIDERYTRGPLETLRQRPQLGLVVSALLIVAGLVVVGAQGSGRSSPHQAAQSDVLPQNAYGALAVLGPKVGDNVNDYISKVGQGLIAAAQQSPDVARVALVSFTDYRTPEDANALLTGFTVNRAFLRARAAGIEAQPLPIEVRGALLVALRRAYADTAHTRAEAHSIYQSYVDTLKPMRTQDKKFRDLYETFARSSAIEANAFANDCACVFSVVVTASPSQLLGLRARTGIRAVEVAPPSLTVAQVQVQPLQPDVKGTVPRPVLGGPG